MQNLGNRNFASIVDIRFNSSVFGTGAGQSFGGSPTVAVFKGNSTTPLTTGVTFTPDLNSVAGRHHIRIDLSTDTTNYSENSDFFVEMTAGTVGGVAVTGKQIASFSIHNGGVRRPLVYFADLKYGLVGQKIRVQVNKTGGGGFATSTSYIPDVADFKISIDSGAEASINTVPSFVNGWLEIVPIGAEVTGKQITLRVADATPKAIDDVAIIIRTYGDPNAYYPNDVSVATRSIDDYSKG